MKPLKTALTLLALFTATPALAKVNPYRALPGPFAVGTAQLELLDTSRAEPFSSDASRRRLVLVQAWYPATVDASAVKAPYLLSPVEFSGDQKDANMLRFFHENVETRSYLKAPLAASASKFPVVLYNPGGGNPRFVSSFTAEELASKGYVVLAIEHLGDGMSTHLPDGRPLNLDRRVSWKNELLDSEEAREKASVEEITAQIFAALEIRTNVIFPAVTGDSRYVLDLLPRLSQRLFKGQLDLSRIGAYGWSQGGAASIDLLVKDSRVKAAVDHDGQFLSPDRDAASFRTAKPFLLLHNGDVPAGDTKLSKAEAQAGVKVEAEYQRFFNASSGPRFRATVSGTDHGYFSDWMLFYHYKGEKRALTHPRMHLIADLTNAFFDRYLKGEPAELPLASPFLTGVQRAGEEK